MYDYNHKPLTAHHPSVHAYSITVWGAEGPDEGTSHCSTAVLVV